MLLKHLVFNFEGISNANIEYDSNLNIIKFVNTTLGSDLVGISFKGKNIKTIIFNGITIIDKSITDTIVKKLYIFFYHKFFLYLIIILKSFLTFKMYMKFL